MNYTHAIVRGVSSKYSECLVTHIKKTPIALWLAQQQHQAYIHTLSQLGLEVIELPADSDLADCCFVEDIAIVLPEIALLTRPGALERRKETIEMANLFNRLFTYHEVFKAPAVIDGGDVLVIGKTIYVGLSQRTNLAAIEQLKQFLSPFDYQVIGVAVKGVLHLTSACTYIGQNTIVMAPELLDSAPFKGFQIIYTLPEEIYAANCLAINGKVLIPQGYPHLQKQLDVLSFSTISLDMSEFRKGEGALTCLSVLWQVG